MSRGLLVYGYPGIYHGLEALGIVEFQFFFVEGVEVIHPVEGFGQFG